VVFYEIHQAAVREAMAQPRETIGGLVNAQARRGAPSISWWDSSTPLCGRRFGRAVGGRVQSPALR